MMETSASSSDSFRESEATGGTAGRSKRINFNKIEDIRFLASQQQELFDRLPAYSDFQKLTISKAFFQTQASGRPRSVLSDRRWNSKAGFGKAWISFFAPPLQHWKSLEINRTDCLVQNSAPSKLHQLIFCVLVPNRPLISHSFDLRSWTRAVSFEFHSQSFKVQNLNEGLTPKNRQGESILKEIKFKSRKPIRLEHIR